MAPTLLLIGMLLIAAGFAIITIFLLIELLRSTKRKEGEVEKRGGAVVMVGPFPIILASDPKMAKTLLMLAIMLTLILVALTILSYGLSRLG